MNAVIYFSCSGQSALVAEKVANKLSCEIFEYNKFDLECKPYLAIIVFPVHCQGLPKPFKRFLKNFTAENVALVATYGRQSPGNAIYEAAKLCKKVVAALYLPAKHTYLDEEFTIPEIPQAFYDKILLPAPVKIPKRVKYPFAGVFPSFRSRLILKIKKSDGCDACGICNAICPASAIYGGKINGKCIRCLKCVNLCPKKALTYKKSFILDKYLKKPSCEKVILYV